MRFVSGGYARLGENFRTIKRKMREANDEAHHEIEQTLRANNNQPVGVGPILTKYRTLINEYSIELRGIVGDETAMLSNEFKLAPPKGGVAQTAADGESLGTNTASDAEARGKLPRARTRSSVDMPREFREPGDDGVTGLHPRRKAVGRTVVDRQLVPSASPQRVAAGMPSLPQVPSAPRAGSPLSSAPSSGMGPLAGLMGSVNPASGASGIGEFGCGAAEPGAGDIAALGADFGRGVAAGANAAGAASIPAQPVPQAPSAPSGVPPAGGATPASAAPTTASAPSAPLAAQASGSSLGSAAAGPHRWAAPRLLRCPRMGRCCRRRCQRVAVAGLRYRRRLRR